MYTTVDTKQFLPKHQDITSRTLKDYPHQEQILILMMNIKISWICYPNSSGWWGPHHNYNYESIKQYPMDHFQIDLMNIKKTDSK